MKLKMAFIILFNQNYGNSSKQEDGMLIRLSLRKDEVVATLFDERKLGIATREQIEVR